MSKGTSKHHPILIFADGASRGNPGPGGWGAVIVLPEGRVMELGEGNRETTNNRMELAAVIFALRKVADIKEKTNIYTDSVYVIRGITQWIWAWRRRDWKTADGKDVSNVDQWQALFEVVSRRGKDGAVSWHYVRGHSGIPGNERVDVIATSFASGRRPALYDGPLLRYDVPIHDIPEDTSLPEMRDPAERAAKKAEPYSYLSVVGGVPRRHANWTDCERQVKGRSGAKFKKVMSASEEETVLAAWGYRLKDVREGESGA